MPLWRQLWISIEGVGTGLRLYAPLKRRYYIEKPRAGTQWGYLTVERNWDRFHRGFSTSQAWQLLRVSSPIVSWYEGVWFSAATPKFSVITWLAIRDRLATGERVLRWNPQADATCVLCSGTMETRDHLFLCWPYSEEIWRKLIGNLVGWDTQLSGLSYLIWWWTREGMTQYYFLHDIPFRLWYTRYGESGTIGGMANLHKAQFKLSSTLTRRSGTGLSH